MGSAVKSVGRALGVSGEKGHGPGPKLNKQPFDIKKQAAEYEQLAKQQQAAAQARQTALNAPAVLAQLSAQALGQGPSLAEAQLKSATNRNLAQQLAAASSMRGRNPAAQQRQLLMQQGDAGRQLAEQSAVARLQEQQQAQQQLAQQQQQADAFQNQAINSGFTYAVAPQRELQNYEMTRFGADVAKTNAIRAEQNGILKGLIGAGGNAIFPGAGSAASSGMVGGGAPTGAVGKWQGGRIDGYEQGGKVPGKAKVDKDSPKNDMVHALLSPGEIVVPKSHAKTPEKAKAFIDALMQTEHSTDDGKGYQKVLAQQDELRKRIRRLEAKGYSDGGEVEAKDAIRGQQNDALEADKRRDLEQSMNYRKESFGGDGASSELNKYLADNYERKAIEAGLAKKRLREGYYDGGRVELIGPDIPTDKEKVDQQYGPTYRESLVGPGAMTEQERKSLIKALSTKKGK